VPAIPKKAKNEGKIALLKTIRRASSEGNLDATLLLITTAQARPDVQIQYALRPMWRILHVLFATQKDKLLQEVRKDAMIAASKDAAEQ
jgi:hypothetical protein